MIESHKFAGFILRRGARGRASNNPVTNKATIVLFNDETNRSSLLVWAIRIDTIAAAVVGVSQQRGQVSGQTAGTVDPYYTSDPKPPGALGAVESATSFTADFVFDPSIQWAAWDSAFPLAVIDPGCALIFQAGTAAKALGVSLVWDWRTPDELYGMEPGHASV